MRRSRDRYFRRAAPTAGIVAIVSVFMLPTFSFGQTKTLSNLLSAYAIESREQLLYTEYARKADQEGYGRIASLFRAIARAEEIHAAKKAALITAMNGVPVTDPQPIIVRTTRDNLREALTAEAYESDMLYAGFAKRAREENFPDAEQVFRLEQAVEPQHRTLIEQALLHLETYRGRNIAFPVCPNCGYTDRTLPEIACPNCQTPAAQFEWIK